MLDKIVKNISDKMHAKTILLQEENHYLLLKLNELEKQLNQSELEYKAFQGKMEESKNLNDELKKLKISNLELRKNLSLQIKENRDQIEVITKNKKQLKTLNENIKYLKEQNKKLELELKNKSLLKLKKRCKELEKLLTQSENIVKANVIYRMTYEYISQNKESVKDVFQHNFKLWLDTEKLTNVKAAKILGVTTSAITDWKNGRTSLTVNSIQNVDLVLCQYFKCSVYELVTKKMA